MDTLVKQPFNPAQIEIINTMAQLNTDEDLVELRQTISKFFADRADKEMERLWEAGVINNEVVEQWGKEHLRTPYNHKI